MNRKTRVVVLGGGIGGLSTAMALSATPELRQRFAVTVYSQGWRLGGKAASGRNTDHAMRIEEHGIHMLMGFYDHAFAQLRTVYAERPVGPDNPFRTWQDAFHPQRLVAVGTPGTPGYWEVRFPQTPGTPGDPRTEAELDLLESVVRLLEGLAGLRSDVPTLHTSQPLGTLDALALKAGVLALRGALAAGASGEHLLATVVAVSQRVTKTLAQQRPGEEGHIFLALDLGLAILRGVLRDVLPHGIASINHLDFREWLARSGATPQAVDSAFVRSLYDLGFCYRGGREAEPAVEAGTMLSNLLRMLFTYRDAPMFRMMSGMGDVVVAPIYEVLRQRGVEVHLFHRVSGLDAVDGVLSAVHLSRQAECVNGRYEPLMTVKGLPCFPTAPFWEQLVDGAALKAAGADFESIWCEHSVGQLTLAADTDFDVAVLALPIGAQLCLSGTLWEGSALGTSRQQIATVQTQGVQLWFDADFPQLGWRGGQVIVAGGTPPLGSWADMTDLLVRECWEDTPPPRALAYLCGVIPDQPVPDKGSRTGRHFIERCADHVCHDATGWVQADAGAWFTALGTGDQLDWALLHAPAELVGRDRMRAQFFRANVDPSERYVQSLPGTSIYRVEPGDPGIENLYAAGDWARTSINGGAAEAAVEAGHAAAQAIIDRD